MTTIRRSAMVAAIMVACALMAAPAVPIFAQGAPGSGDRYSQREQVSPSAASVQAIRATFTVSPGQSIQAAVERARPGDRIVVMPGTYHESVTVDFDNIELIGIVEDGERPVLDGQGKLNDGVIASGNNFTISGFEFRNYVGNGVLVNKAHNVTFRDIVAYNPGKYGLYPVECTGVTVDSCVVSGAWDAGIYAGQCRDVLIQNSEAYHNTIGFEAENCVNVLIANNSAHDNSLGILVVLLPDLPAKQATHARVINNRVFNNNYPNLSPEGHMVNVVEPGLGIAINAADNTEVTRNQVVGNNSYGISLYSLTDIFPPERKLDVEPNPDGNYIHHNVLAKNGSKVSPRYAQFNAPGGDIFWSGKGVGNGWQEDTKLTFPLELPAWGGGIGSEGL